MQGSICICVCVLLAVTATPAAGLPADMDPVLRARLQTDHTDTEGYVDLLFQAADALQQVSEVEELLLEFLPRVEGDSHRHRVYWRLAELYELSADFDRSQRYYHAAYGTRPHDPIGIEALYRSANLLLELGDLQAARLQSYTILERSEDAAMRRQTGLLLARAYTAEGDFARALELLDNMSRPISGDSSTESLALLTLFEIAQLGGNRQRATFAVEQLRQHYPDSIEMRVIGQEWSGQIGLFPTPARLTSSIETAVTDFIVTDIEDSQDIPTGASATSTIVQQTSPQERPPIIGLQTGSFRQRSNAEKMVAQLAELGYRASIKSARSEDTRLFQVIIPFDSTVDSDQAAAALTQNGIGSFLLFAD